MTEHCPPSKVVYLSERNTKRPPPSLNSVKSAGLPLSPVKDAILKQTLQQLLEISDSPLEFVTIAAALASSAVQALQKAGMHSAPWIMADLYQRFMEDDDAPAAS